VYVCVVCGVCMRVWCLCVCVWGVCLWCVSLFKQLDYKSKMIVTQDAIITAKAVKVSFPCQFTQQERQYNELFHSIN